MAGLDGKQTKTRSRSLSSLSFFLVPFAFGVQPNQVTKAVAFGGKTRLGCTKGEKRGEEKGTKDRRGQMETIERMEGWKE